MEAAYADQDSSIIQTSYDWSSIRNYSHANHWNYLVLTGENGSFNIANGLNETSSGENTWIISFFILACCIIYFGWLSLKKRLIPALAKRSSYFRYNNLEKPNTIQKFPKESNLPSSTSNSRMQKLVDKTLQILKERFTEDLRSKEIAAELNVSDRHLQRSIKEVTQTTFRNLINEMRLEESAKRLENSDASISEICYKNGF